jgi:AraC family transcriptional regulator of adaptative response/methylated-DNA-[protein]-cysteine methyltransferase
MIAITSDTALYLLEFIDRPGLECEIELLGQKTKSVIISGRTDVINVLEKELQLYFSGELKEFKTPLFFLGSPFQHKVWQELQKIPYGQTRAYAELAEAVEKLSAFRAVAQANGKNKIALIVPCHRVINKNGNLGGYSGGINRKKWLIHLEKGERT